MSAPLPHNPPQQPGWWSRRAIWRSRYATLAFTLGTLVGVPGVFLVFAAPAWEDYRARTEYLETTCLVLSTRCRMQIVQPTKTNRHSRQEVPTGKPFPTWHAEVLVRYTLAGGEREQWLSVHKRFSYPQESQAQVWIAPFAKGSTQPLYYDSRDPTSVRLSRGDGGLSALLVGCVMAGIVLGMFGGIAAFGWWGWWCTRKKYGW